MIIKKDFVLFDWGSSTLNQQHYGQITPPIVDLKNIKGEVPVAMFVGKDDDLGDVIDARWAADEIR